MHSRRSQRHWLGARIEGQWDGLFHTPSIPNLGAQSYSLNMVKPEKLIAIDKQANDKVMHKNRAGKTESLSCQAFETRPAGEVLAFDLLRLLLPHGRCAWIEMAAISPPALRIQGRHAQGRSPC